MEVVDIYGKGKKDSVGEWVFGIDCFGIVKVNMIYFIFLWGFGFVCFFLL